MQTPEEILKEVRSGNASALPAAVLLKRIIESAEAAYKEVRTVAYEDFLNYGKKEITVDGATIKEYPGRTTYNYDNIPAHQMLKNKIKALEDRHKHAAKVWLDKGEQLVDEETGEYIVPADCTSSPNTIAISL